MGVFDTVVVRGACKCGGDVEFQSKGADMPWMETYEGKSVPIEVASDCGDGWCSVCNARHTAVIVQSITEVRAKRS